MSDLKLKLSIYADKKFSSKERGSYLRTLSYAQLLRLKHEVGYRIRIANDELKRKSRNR